MKRYCRLISHDFDFLDAVADAIYLTIINSEFQGDAFFPDMNLNDWSEVEREDIKDDPDVAFSYSFLKFEKSNQNIN